MRGYTATDTAGELGPMVARLLREQAAAIISNPLKEKAYRALGPGEAVVEYLAWKSSTTSDKTLTRYEGILARLCVKYPQATLEDIDSGQLLAFIHDFEDPSVRLVTVTLRGFFEWAQLWKRLPANAMDLISTPKTRSTRVLNIFTPEEQRKLIASCQGYEMAKRDRAAILLLLDTGARKTDLRLLQWRDVDTVDNVVVFRHRKGDEEGIIDFGDRVQRALIDLYHSDIPRWGLPLTPNDYVLFPSRNSYAGLTWVDPSKPMAESTAHRWWYRCLDRAEITEPRQTAGRKLHLTRHTHGTELYEATGDIEAVRDRLGHKSVNTTQMYVHQSRKRRKASLAALEAYRAALENIPEGDS